MQKRKSTHRQETDQIGSINIPANVLYGIQTQRALALYPTHGEKPLSAYPELIRAMLKVKKAAALTNLHTNEIDTPMGMAIVASIDALLELDELPAEQFPVHSFHGGGGISTNMNINEVIANLANRDHFQQPPGSYTPIHPNEHVNLNHATSDALSTACHLAAISHYSVFDQVLKECAELFECQAEQWKGVPRLSRTCLQDAVAISYQYLFSSHAELLSHYRAEFQRNVEHLFQVNLGGNMIGRQGDCSAAFFEHSIGFLNQVMQSQGFTRMRHLLYGSQNHTTLLLFVSHLEQFASALLKLAKDFRLMASGPEAGFGELILPAVQAGSSTMPGKINPTVPEYLIHCCMQAMGRCYSARLTQAQGELEYSPWQMIVIINLLDAVSCLEEGVRSFSSHCLNEVKPDIERNRQNVNTLIPTLVKLRQQKGYAYAVEVLKTTKGDLEAIRRHLAPAAAFNSGE